MTIEDSPEQTDAAPENEETDTNTDEDQPSAVLAPAVEEATEEPAAEEPAAEESSVEEPKAEAPADGRLSESAEEPDASVSSATEEPEAGAEASGPEEAAAGAPEGNGAGEGDPFRGPGDWYVIHTYAGYENKVKANLETRVQTMQMQEKIFDVQIPMEDVMEIKGGKKQVVQKKVFPGYLLVKMVYDDDSWVCVRNTPGVTGFVSSGTGQKPTPLSRREVEKILTVEKEETKKPAFRLDFEEGDVVRIISGPFADFNGTISDINVAQSKVRVMVNIFDRETPVELSFDQVARV